MLNIKLLALLLISTGMTSVCGAEQRFLIGGDISALPKLESCGAVYTVDGNPQSAIKIMRDHGCNCFRVRLFVNPTMKNVVVQDLEFVKKLGKRIKDSGGEFLLDLHYSDTWADPGHQIKPAAWDDLSFEELEERVESYTAEVIKELKIAGVIPDIVQVGNEISHGMLWPDGKPGDHNGGWEKLGRLLKAGVSGVKSACAAGETPGIMMHSASGGSFAKTCWFFENLEKQSVEYDLIGLSYYPWWHGTLADVKDNLQKTAVRFKKPMVVVETAYPWRKHKETKNMNWPATKEGQKLFLSELVTTVKAAPDGLGRGVIWWYPESIKTDGVHIWKGGDVALFDEKGEALPSLKAFGEGSR